MEAAQDIEGPRSWQHDGPNRHPPVAAGTGEGVYAEDPGQEVLRLLDPPGLRTLLARKNTLVYAVLPERADLGKAPHAGLLHAKVWISDRKRAVVTSANLTGGGLYANREIGVCVGRTESGELLSLLRAWTPRPVTRRTIQQLAQLKEKYAAPQRPSPIIPPPLEFDFSRFAEDTLAGLGLDPEHILHGLGRGAFRVRLGSGHVTAKVHCSEADARSDFHFEVSRPDHEHMAAGRVDGLIYLPYDHGPDGRLMSVAGQPQLVWFPRDVLYGRGGMHRTAFDRAAVTKRKVSFRPGSQDLYLYNRTRGRHRQPATFPLVGADAAGGILVAKAPSPVSTPPQADHLVNRGASTP